MKKYIVLLLAFALLLACCGCGQESVGVYRTLETIGTKHYSVICRSGDPLAETVNAAMNVLAANGRLLAASTQWLGMDAITLEGDARALDSYVLPEPATAPAEDAEPGEGETAPERTLIIGVEAGFNPMAFERYGELTGMSVDIGTQIGEALHCPVAFQPIDAADVGAQLASGNIDCALGFDPSVVSASKYDVGVSYMDSDILLAVPAESEVRRLKDLKGLRIGITEDPVVQDVLKADEKITKYASGATVYLSTPRCFSALESDWCSAVAMDHLRLLYEQPD